MSRDDRTNIFKCIIKKRGKCFVVYIVKWMQSDPDYWTDEMFIKIMTGQKYTHSLKKAVQIAHIIDAQVGGSEYKVTLVERYNNVILSGDAVLRDDAHQPYLSDQSDIFEQYDQGYQKIPTGTLYYSIYGNCYSLYDLDDNKYNLDNNTLGLLDPMHNPIKSWYCTSDDMTNFNPKLTPLSKKELPTLVQSVKPTINTSPIMTQIKKDMIYNIKKLEKALIKAKTELEALT